MQMAGRGLGSAGSNMFLELSLQQVLMRFAALLVTVAVHGYVLAFASRVLGDPTPRFDGRQTLNPLVHMDLFGSVAGVLFLPGWIKPVKLDHNSPLGNTFLRATVALAALASNFLLASLLMLSRPLLFTLLPPNGAFAVLALVNTTIEMQLWFVAANIWPIPPATSHLVWVSTDRLSRLRSSLWTYLSATALALLVLGILLPPLRTLQRGLGHVIGLT